MAQSGFWQRKRPTRAEKVTVGASLLMVVAMALILVAEHRTGTVWQYYAKLGIAPLGLAEWVLALTYVWRARIAEPGDRFSPRSNRQLATIFFILGAASIALTAYQLSKGA